MNISGKTVGIVFVLILVGGAYLFMGRDKPVKKTAAKRSSRQVARKTDEQKTKNAYFADVSSFKRPKGVQKIPQPDGGQMILDNDWRVINGCTMVFKLKYQTYFLVSQSQLFAFKYGNDADYEFNIIRGWLETLDGRKIKATEKLALHLLNETFKNPKENPENYQETEHCLPLTEYERGGRKLLFVRKWNKASNRYMEKGICLTDAGMYTLVLNYPAGIVPENTDAFIKMFENWTPGNAIKEIDPVPVKNKDGWDRLKLVNGKTCDMLKKMIFVGHDERPFVITRKGDNTYYKQVVYMGASPTFGGACPERVVCIEVWKTDGAGKKVICSPQEFNAVIEILSKRYSFGQEDPRQPIVRCFLLGGITRERNRHIVAMFSYREDNEQFCRDANNRIIKSYR